MNKTFLTISAEETRALGKTFAQELKPGTLVCFEGGLGAGKTTLIQGILEGVGAMRPYVSPTFVIMKQYDLPQQTTTGIARVYHCDAYRVEAKDFEAIGFAEWCADPEGLTLLEWPTRVAEILPKKALHISLTAKSETEREILVNKELFC